MRTTLRSFALLLLSLAAAQAWAGSCTSADNGQYLGGRKPVLDNDALTESTIALCYRDYNLYASTVTGGNLWSAQRLTRAKVEGAESISRISMRFFKEDGLDTSHDSYTNSGYDRGHMMPAGDASTTTAQRETFSVANIVPQVGTLNRGPWAKIESIVRMLATSYGEVYVVTGPDFEDLSTTLDSGRVVVPTQTWKAVYVPDAGVAGAYWCQNRETSACQVISIAQLQRTALVDPFPDLGAGLREQDDGDWQDVLVLP